MASRMPAGDEPTTEGTALIAPITRKSLIAAATSDRAGQVGQYPPPVMHHQPPGGPDQDHLGRRSRKEEVALYES